MSIEDYWMLNQIFFSTLFQRFISSHKHSFGFTNIYDIVLFNNSTEIDKVASASFRVSYNELIALVLLLLIAIIIIIAIS